MLIVLLINQKDYEQLWSATHCEYTTPEIDIPQSMDSSSQSVGEAQREL
jgi:hypothetical protein